MWTAKAIEDVLLLNVKGEKIQMAILSQKHLRDRLSFLRGTNRA